MRLSKRSSTPQKNMASLRYTSSVIFWVINHGIPEELIDDVISVAQEFFEMPVEDKAPYYSEDPTKDTRLFTGQGFRKENIHFWRDCLIMSAYPVEKYEHQFPEKPDNLKRIMGKFVPEGRKLVRRLLELISKGLGLEEDYLTGDISEGSMKMVFNYYPPCPDPSLTLGLPKHCDITLINLLLQGNVSGLQVLHDDNWISVDPLPNSFVVNFGLLLEVISNGLLKAVEHRAVTNKNVARTSIAMAIRSTDDCIICPAEVLVSEEHNPPVYRSFRFPDLFEVFSTKNADDKEIMMKDFRIKN
ncbi:2'-deoxymugineic-acid 2'-dioxygenase-like isoform X2 [Asparagus officinalis]|uniref:2'-deoxymugineic-acid 2'-dioxygenase-like isoform X2 n=1 Tax=Asparagus officinalis TaxID=4686 RepID=UPI00098DF999|nr:2'-deoxymugineic-acid 2'-dioxygenase-like isoform X2 [Asparagus officinalis]